MDEIHEEPKEEIQTIFSVGLQYLFLILSGIFLVSALLMPHSKWWELPLVISLIAFCVFKALDRWPIK